MRVYIHLEGKNAGISIGYKPHLIEPSSATMPREVAIYIKNEIPGRPKHYAKVTLKRYEVKHLAKLMNL